MSAVKKEKEPMARLEIRLPRSTKQKLVSMCGHQISASVFIRQIIESGQLPDVPAMSACKAKKAMLEPLIVEFSRVGNNLNQSAKAMHLIRQLYDNCVNNRKLNDLEYSAVLCSSLTKLNSEVEQLSKARSELQNLMKDLITWCGENAS